MLATALFIGFWVLLAFSLFFIAARGGVGGARAAFQTQTRGGRKIVTVIFVIVYVGFGIALPIAFLTGNHAKASDQVQDVKLTNSDKRGREIFGEVCSTCHTLAAANANGKVGPNLDMLKPPYSLVYNTINNGCVQDPPPGSPQSCLGQGTMPPQLLQGRDANQVAEFVSKVAGKA